MNEAKQKLVLAFLPLVGLLMAAARPAFATPYAAVSDASWNASAFSFYANDTVVQVPPGLAISCYGDATGEPGGAGCTLNLTATFMAIGSEDHYSVTESGGFELTNTSDQTIDGGLNYQAVYSANGAIVSVDNTSTQYGALQLSYFGPDVEAGYYSCSVGVGSHFSYCLQSRTPQGQAIASVPVGDGPSGIFFSGDEVDLAPGASMKSLPYSITFAAQFLVPEPSSMALLASGLLLALVVSPRSRRQFLPPLRRR